MASKLYDYGLNFFAQGGVTWKASGGSTVKAFLVDLAVYTPNFSTDEFAADIPQAARKGNAGGYNDSDAPALTLSDSAAGVCDAADVTFTAVPAGNALGALVLYVSTGNLATSRLLCYIDTATGLPVTPNGADITIQWDNGSNKIFKL